ncbi:MAG: hypothetical protein JJU00_03105 [Opitutales bacterium]|nr:hypothetical protein [Opitutales bacterium]
MKTAQPIPGPALPRCLAVKAAALVGMPAALAAETQLFDIRDPLRIWTRLEWYFVLGGIAAAALLVLLYLRLRKRREAAAVQSIRIPTAFDIAREALERLERESAAMTAEAFSVNASRVLRVFIEDTLNLPATERTTEEFLREFQDEATMDAPARHALEAFLEQCDLAKFGRQDLSAEARAGLLANARAFVDAVERARRPQPGAAENAAAPA